MKLQIKPGSETEQASPTGMIWLGPKDRAPFCYFTVSVTHHVVYLLLSSFVSSSIHLISICRLESFEGSMVVSRFISKFGCKALLSQHKTSRLTFLVWFLALYHTVSFSRNCAIFEIINQKCILLMRQLAPASSLVLSLPSHILIMLDVILERTRNMQGKMLSSCGW